MKQHKTYVVSVPGPKIESSNNRSSVLGHKSSVPVASEYSLRRCSRRSSSLSVDQRLDLGHKVWTICVGCYLCGLET